MSSKRTQIDYDYNGSWDNEDALVKTLEYPVGDLFDDDTFWQEDDEEAED